jgi:hypothetical protein
MLGNEGQAASSQIMLSPVSAANTAAATSGWIDVRAMKGDIVVVVQAGAITGSIAWTLEDANTSGGGASAGITPNEGAFATVTANQVQRRTINANAHRGWIRCVGTIVTGPVLVAASCHSRPAKTYSD